MHTVFKTFRWSFVEIKYLTDFYKQLVLAGEIQIFINMKRFQTLISLFSFLLFIIHLCGFFFMKMKKVVSNIKSISDVFQFCMEKKTEINPLSSRQKSRHA